MSLRRLVLILLCCLGYAGYGYLSAGCMAPTQGDVCTMDEQCGEGLRCDAGTCEEPTCTGDADLDVPPGGTCDEDTNAIIEPVRPGDCPEGQVADERSGECVPIATGDGDCGPGEQEAGGLCTDSPCQGAPYDSCPEGFVCNGGTGGCEAGAKVCGVVPNPTNEVCETATAEIRDRCPEGGECPAGQACNVVDGYCEPVPCTLPDGFECTGQSICDPGELVCVAACVFTGCALFDTCNERTGVCIGTSPYQITLPPTAQYLALVDAPVIDVQLTIFAGQVQIHTIELTLQDGLTLPFFDVAPLELLIDGVPLPVDVIDGTTATVPFDPDPGAPVAERPVVKRTSATTARLTLPEGGDGVLAQQISDTTATLRVRMPVEAPGVGLYGWDVTATGVDASSGGRADHLAPDPVTASESYLLDVSPDSDGDGLSDSQETLVTGTDPNNADTDFDGLPDQAELFFGTSAVDADSDDDGALDGAEAAAGSDPLDATFQPEPQVLDRFDTPAVSGAPGLTFETSPPFAWWIDSLNDVAGIAWIDPGTDSVGRMRIVAGVVEPDVVIYDAADVPAACAGYTGVHSGDGIGANVLLTVDCDADAQRRVLLGDVDGTGALTVVLEPGDLVGGEAVDQVFDATFVGDDLDPALVVTGHRASGDFVAQASPPFTTFTLRATAADLGFAGLDPAQVEADEQFAFVLDGAQQRLARLDRAGTGATGTSVIVDATAGAASPFASVAQLAGVGAFAVGGGSVAALVQASDGREGIVRFDVAGAVQGVVAEVDVPLPGGTYGGTSPGLRSPTGLTVHGDRVAFDGLDQLSSRALFASGRRVDGSAGAVRKVFHADDSFGATNAVLLNGATGGRASRSLTGSRGMLGDAIASVVLFAPDFDVAVFRPDVPVPRARLLALRPAGSGTSLYRFLTSPPIFSFVETLGTSSLSGADRNPLNGEVRLSAGFSGAVDPNVGGGISSYGTGAGPLAFVGQTASLTATPGLTFDGAGALFASASTDSGAADTLASIDPATGADTVVAPFFVAPATPAQGIDALEFVGGAVQALWAVSGTGFDGTPGDVLVVDPVTAELTPIGDLPEAYASIAGVSSSEAGDLFVSAGGSGGGWIAWVDASALMGAPPPGVVDLPLRVLADVQILNQSISDLIVIDSDGDGLDDLAEAGFGTSPTDADSDGDGLGDGAEALNLPTLADDADSDDDGLDDGAERLVHGTNPVDADTDDDGADDGLEIASGTDPLDPLDFPSAVVPGLGWPALGLLALLLAAVPAALRGGRGARLGRR